MPTTQVLADKGTSQQTTGYNTNISYDEKYMNQIVGGSNLQNFKAQLTIALEMVNSRIKELEVPYSKMDQRSKSDFLKSFDSKTISEFEKNKAQVLTIATQLRSSLKKEIITLNTNPSKSIFFIDTNPKNNKAINGKAMFAHTRKYGKTKGIENGISFTQTGLQILSKGYSNRLAQILIHELSHQNRNGIKLEKTNVKKGASDSVSLDGVRIDAYGVGNSDIINKNAGGGITIQLADPLALYFSNSSITQIKVNEINRKIPNPLSRGTVGVSKGSADSKDFENGGKAFIAEILKIKNSGKRELYPAAVIDRAVINAIENRIGFNFASNKLILDSNSQYPAKIAFPNVKDTNSLTTSDIEFIKGINRAAKDTRVFYNIKQNPNVQKPTTSKIGR